VTKILHSSHVRYTGPFDTPQFEAPKNVTSTSNSSSGTADSSLSTVTAYGLDCHGSIPSRTGALSSQHCLHWLYRPTSLLSNGWWWLYFHLGQSGRNVFMYECVALHINIPYLSRCTA
jgi:hypothetical protein